MALVRPENRRTYYGWDLSQGQIDANYAEAFRNHVNPTWIHGDGIRGLACKREAADMILTCPPYHNTEKYTTHEDDLSNMGWETHLERVQDTWHAAYTALKPNRFVAWVTGDLRNPTTGQLRLLPERTTLAAEDAGFRIVNTHILAQPIGTKYRLVRRWWEGTRSAGRTHQHVIVAVKGDRKRAVEAINDAHTITEDQ